MESYILEHYESFDAVKFLESTCPDLSRDLAIYQFETIIDALPTKESCPEAVKKWCQNVKQYNYEVINTDESLAYWDMRSKARMQLNTSLYHADLDAAASDRLLAVSSSMQRKVSAITRMKRKADTPKREADGLVFNGVSVGTTIKRHGESLAVQYKELNSKQKHVAGLCLNSVIDLSDETVDSQRRFFSDEEWAVMRSKYQFSTKPDKQVFKPLFKKINKAMKNADLHKAYKIARTAESAALNSDKEHIFNIYAHIINIYRHRSSSLNNSMKDNTELDSLVKFWAEVFESLFPDSKHNVKCKWGESKAHHNEYKVDCRVIVIKDTQKVDLLDVEAARYMQNQKTNDDHLKLTIESKGVLDHVVRHAGSFNPTKAVVFMLQVCQNQCDVKALALCDRGLYCLWKQASLTLPSCPKAFAENSHSWFATLELIRTSTIKLAQLLEQHDGKSYDSHFNRKGKGKTTDYKDWLRGTFFPPDKAEDPVILPVPLYDPASNETETEPAKKQRTIF